MSAVDLTAADLTIDLGARVLRMLAEGWDGAQIRERLNTTPDEAERALAAYATRVLRGTTPAMPSPDCGSGGYDGWCYTHGLYHAAATA